MEKALVFYDAIMATIGATRTEEIKLDDVGLVAVAYGKQFPEFWIQLPDNREPAAVGNGIHVGFVAVDKDMVHRFYDAALQNGGKDNGAPGPRPHYGEPYYGCFVFDPDGNKVEATFWDMSKMTG
jgi:catechol 2,3-dioxygenase-like lactoylglutathione lyase family enzyme